MKAREPRVTPSPSNGDDGRDGQARNVSES